MLTIDLSDATCPDDLAELLTPGPHTPVFNAVLAATPAEALAGLPQGWPSATAVDPEADDDPDADTADAEDDDADDAEE